MYVVAPSPSLAAGMWKESVDEPLVYVYRVPASMADLLTSLYTKHGPDEAVTVRLVNRG